MKTIHRLAMTDEYIAEAQRRAISQNTLLKLMYQTWWVTWPPRLGMAAFIVYCWYTDSRETAAVFAFLLALAFIAHWSGRRGLAKARRNVRGRGSTSVVSMDDAGVDIDGQLGSSHLHWAAMLPPAIYSDGVLIKFSRASMVWLPDFALAEGSPEEVRQLLVANVKASSDESTRRAT